MFEKQNVAQIVMNKLGLKETKNDLIEWHDLCKSNRKIDKTVEIALVGKYVSLHDAYISIYEALNHAGVFNGVNVKIRWVDSEKIEEESQRLKMSVNRMKKRLRQTLEEELAIIDDIDDIDY